MLTEMTADAVRPVRTERLAVMNLYWYQNERSPKNNKRIFIHLRLFVIFPCCPFQNLGNEHHDYIRISSGFK